MFRGGTMESARYEELRCYQLAMALLKAAYRLAEQLPDFEKYNLASQLRRAALSTTLNIAEGYGRFHFPDKLRFFYYARGSLFETLSGFLAAHTVGYIDDEQMTWARQTAALAGVALNGYINHIRKQRQGAQTFGEHHVREATFTYETTPSNPQSPIPNPPIPQSLPRNTAVVAIGGNSLIRDRQHQDVASQWEAVRETCVHITDMIERGWNLVITHGNGPQVGFILRRNELAAHEMHITPTNSGGGASTGRSSAWSRGSWSTAMTRPFRTRPRALAALPQRKKHATLSKQAGTRFKTLVAAGGG
jgi:four helix bundle protein